MSFYILVFVAGKLDKWKFGSPLLLWQFVHEIAVALELSAVEHRSKSKWHGSVGGC